MKVAIVAYSGKTLDGGLPEIREQAADQSGQHLQRSRVARFNDVRRAFFI
jgi:hypothetical protein